MTEPLYVAPSLADLPRHVTFPQNLPSIVCVHVLDPQPGDVILDMCAAPGYLLIYLYLGWSLVRLNIIMQLITNENVTIKKLSNFELDHIMKKILKWTTLQLCFMYCQQTVMTWSVLLFHMSRQLSSPFHPANFLFSPETVNI